MQTWKTFVRNHMEGFASIDLFVVPTIAFQRLFAFQVLGHERRRLLRFAVTRNPTAEWLARQITEAFFWDSAPKYLIRDNDRAFGVAFKAHVRATGDPGPAHVVPLTLVGLDWQFAGIAAASGAGTSDLVLRNANGGALEVYDIANNQLTGAAPLGSVGLDWQLGGFAVDPPTGSMGSSDSASQLVQAMAGFGSSGAGESLTLPLSVPRHHSSRC
jgi:hypothetical protein